MNTKPTDTNIRHITKAVCLVFVLGIFLYIAITSSSMLSSSFAKVPAQIFVSLCNRVMDKTACYEENVPKLMLLIPVESIFPIIREIQNLDKSYQFCHVLAHKLGEQEVAKNSDAWMDLMHKNPPDSLCSNGYIHGVIVGRFNYAELPQEKIDAIEPDLASACESKSDWHPTNLDRAMCYHGMGHVLTFITGANMPLAVSFCKKIAVKNNGEDYSQTCISGVFMQIFQPLEPEDFELIARLPVKPTRSTLAAFCGVYTTQEERSLCFGEGWPLFRTDLQTASGVQSFCTTTKDIATQTNCYRTAFSIGARGSLGNPDKQAAICRALPLALGKQCLGILANAFIEENRTQSAKAVAICEAAPAAYTDACFQYLLNLTSFNFTPGSKDAATFCAALPVVWQSSCARVVPAPLQ